MTEFEQLDESDCLRLLATTDVGRFAVMADGYPTVFPVNYIIDGNVITFRTAPGTKFDASLHSKVGFEVDHIADDRRSAWSVLVLGSVDRQGMTEEERDRVTRLAVNPLVQDHKPLWVRIVPDRITGRRLTAEDEPLAFDSRGYL